MIGNLKVPTIFTAVDKVSKVVDGMQRKVSGFQKTLSKGLNYGAAVGGGLLLASLPLVYDAITKYDDALASFRTIVSDLNDADFSKYQKGIERVAKETQRSTVDIANSYETIAGLNADFAKTPQSIEHVAKANAILARASRMELGESAASLVGIMNQYSLAADQSDRVINVLAAGQAVGAASIKQTAEAYVNFGAVASGANITLEQSTALIQTLGKYSLFGAEAGTKLRGSVLQLQKAGLGYASGQFKINDALNETSKNLSKLTTEKAKDAYLTKIFGAENITAGRILLNNISTYEDFTKAVTGTSEAQKAADINAGTLLARIQSLRDAFTNYITTNDESNKSLGIAKDVIGYVTANLDTLIPIVGSVAVGLVALKAITFAYTTITSSAAIAQGFFAATIGATLLPITLVLGAIVAIIAMIVYWDDICGWFSKQWSRFTNWISGLWGGMVDYMKSFSFSGFFRDIGISILEFFIKPMEFAFALLSKLPGKMGESARLNLGFINDFKVELNKLGSAQLSPNTTAQVATNESISTNNSRVQVDFNDPKNKIGGIKQFGQVTPVLVNGMKFSE